VTAVYVDEPTPHALRVALRALEARNWDAERIRAHAETYAEELFAKALREIVAGEAAQPS
jgi:hypothetical protein